MVIDIFLDSLWQLTLAMAPYIFIGVLFAGILHEIIPADFIAKHLGKNNTASVVKASLFGIPLPICSCGVIPLAQSIQRSGASKGSILSFLISTPITGVDSILATYGIFGWIFTIYRIISAFVIAAVTGILANLFNKDSVRKNENQTKNCCCTCKEDGQNEKKGFWLKNTLNYMSELFQDIAKPLFGGLVIGAVITALIPEDMHHLFAQYNWLSYIIALLIGIPMYVCATSSLPIAAALMLSGVSAGASFVFLSAGPATNTVTMAFIKETLGKRSLFIYLAVIALGSILFGLGLDIIFSTANIDASSLVSNHRNISLLSQISSYALWMFIIFYLIKGYLSSKSCYK